MSRRGAHLRSTRPNLRSRSRAALAAMLTAAISLGGLTACGEGATGDDAVAVGGTFEFVSPGGQTSISYPQEERKEVANLTGESLMEEGEQINLEDYAGKAVVLNTWGQWCGPCRSEADDLERVHEKLEKRGDGTVLGINVRDPSREKPKNFVRTYGITYPSIYDPPFKSALRLGGIPASVIPTTIVLDKQHRPAHIFLKEITDDELWKVLEPILDEEDGAEAGEGA